MTNIHDVTVANRKKIHARRIVIPIVGKVGVNVPCYGKRQQERELEETGDKAK